MKAAQDKAKAEMNNQVDVIKNDFARSKVDFDREKKKIHQEHDNQVSSLKNDFED